MQPEPKELFLCFKQEGLFYIKMILGWNNFYPVIQTRNIRIVQCIDLGNSELTEIRFITRNDIPRFIEYLTFHKQVPEDKIFCDLFFV